MKVLRLIFILGLIIPFMAKAEHQLKLAIGAIEEGDDRNRPELIAGWQINDIIASELHYFGRTQGNVIQKTWLLAISHQYPLLGSKLLHARLGGAFVREQTEIRPATPNMATRQHANNNLGLFLGIGLQSKSPLYFTLDWNNAIFPAGTAGIFLASARKQSLSLGVGWRI